MDTLVQLLENPICTHLRIVSSDHSHMCGHSLIPAPDGQAGPAIRESNLYPRKDTISSTSSLIPVTYRQAGPATREPNLYSCEDTIISSSSIIQYLLV